MAAASLVVTTKQWSTVSGESGNEAIERDGYCGRAKKDLNERLVKLWFLELRLTECRMSSLANNDHRGRIVDFG